MKPNFALKLSNDGIELLHRVTGGWSSVGTVSFETDDVATACEKLVSEAQRREPGFRTKLVMPDDEVRYDAIVAPGPTDEARRYQIEAEIERLTPYRIDDLAYDWSIEGDHALVVICARETLIEAETFAEGYGFNPVSFVAQPTAGQFSGEPFFGETMVAPTLLPPGAHVQPDADPIRVVTARKAAVPAADAPAVNVPARTEAPVKAEAPVSGKDSAKPEGSSKAEVPAPVSARTPPEPARPVPPAGTPVPPVVSRPAEAGPILSGSNPAGAATASTVSGALAPRGPASRAIPAGLPGGNPGASKTGTANGETGKGETGKGETGKSEGGIARVGDLVRRMGTRLRREQVQAQKDSADPSPPAIPAVAPGTQTSPPRPALAGGAPAGLAGSPGKSAEAPAKAGAETPAESVAFASRRAAPPMVASSGPATPPSASGGSSGAPGGRLAVLPEGRAAGGPRLLSRARQGALTALAGVTAAAQTARAKVRPAPGDVPPAAAADATPAVRSSAVPTSAARTTTIDSEKAREAEAMTIFGARGMQNTESTLARRGLMAAGGALLLLIAVAIWALYFNRDETTQLASGSGTSEVASGGGAMPGIEAPEQLAATGEGEAVTPPTALPAPEPAVSEPEVTATAPDATTPETAVPTDPDQMLEALVRQALDETLPTESLDPPIGEVVVAPPAETAAETAQTAAPETVDSDTVATGTAESEAADTATATAGTAETGTASTELAETSDSPQVVTGESTVQRLSLPSGFEVPPAAEVAFTPPPAPPPFGTEFNFNEQGLVEATPDGALTPSGVTVFAGRPASVPAQRPASIGPSAEPETAPEPEASLAPPPSAEPVAAAIESAIAAAVGGALPGAAPAQSAPAQAAPEGIAATPAETLVETPQAAATEAPAGTLTEAAAEAPAAVFDDTPRADPALAGARPQPRPESVRAIGEQLEQEAGNGDQTQLAPEPAPETETAAVTEGDLSEGAPTDEPATLLAAASTLDSAATRAGDGASTTGFVPLSEATAGGVVLAGLRPQRRPTDLAPLAEPEAEAEAAPALDLTGATPEAVAQSPVPSNRPGDLAERARAILAAAAVQQAAPAAAAAAPAAAAPAPGAIAAAPAPAAPAAQAPARSAAPSIPSSASVARAATEENAIRLNRVNLIGVFGSPNSRRALVRLSNGRVVRVQVGDQLDGGQVAAIGDSELRYVKNGRNELLQIGG